MCRPLGECPPTRDGPRRAKKRYTFAEAIAAVDNPNPRRHRRLLASSDYSNSAYDTASLAPKDASSIKRSIVLHKAVQQKVLPSRAQSISMPFRREHNSSFESNASSLTTAGLSKAESLISMASARVAKTQSRLVQGYSGARISDRQVSKTDFFHRNLSMFGGVDGRAPCVCTTTESEAYKPTDRRFTSDWPHEPVQAAVLSSEDRKFATPHAHTMNNPAFPFAKNFNQDNKYPLPDTRTKTDWPHESVQGAVLPRKDRKFATAFAMALNDPRFPFAKRIVRERPKKLLRDRDIYDLSCLDMPHSERLLELAELDDIVHRAIFETVPTNKERQYYTQIMRDRLGRSEWIFDDLPDPWSPDFDTRRGIPEPSSRLKSNKNSLSSSTL